MAADAGDASNLRTKYLDWCSARIADRFLRLPPDEIYDLAHEVSRDATGRLDRESLTLLSLLGITIDVPVEETGVAGASSRSPGDEAGGSRVSTEAAPPDERSRSRAGPAPDGAGGSYRELVTTVAERLAERMDLPSYEAWSRAYRAAPERYDAEMLGFRRDPS